MIRVERGPPPSGFLARAAGWTERHKQACQVDPKTTPSSTWAAVREEITAAGDAEALLQAFRGKCAYCEARMAHVSAPQIEHYRPKSKFPQDMFRWENWLLSCGRCNEAKWAHFPYCSAMPCLIDPSSEKDNPYNHIHFVRERIIHASYRGYVTIKLLGLNRPPMDKERAQWLTLLDLLLLLALESPARAHARTLLIWAMQPAAPFSQMAYCYLRWRAPRLADPVTPHPPIEVLDPLQEIESLLEANQALLRGLL